MTTDASPKRKAIASAKALFADHRLPIAIGGAVAVGALGWAFNTWLTRIPETPDTTHRLGLALGAALLVSVSYFIRRRR